MWQALFYDTTPPAFTVCVFIARAAFACANGFQLFLLFGGRAGAGGNGFFSGLFSAGFSSVVFSSAAALAFAAGFLAAAGLLSDFSSALSSVLPSAGSLVTASSAFLLRPPRRRAGFFSSALASVVSFAATASLLAEVSSAFSAATTGLSVFSCPRLSLPSCCCSLPS